MDVSPLWKWGLSRPPEMAMPNPKPAAYTHRSTHYTHWYGINGRCIRLSPGFVANKNRLIGFLLANYQWNWFKKNNALCYVQWKSKTLGHLLETRTKLCICTLFCKFSKRVSWRISTFFMQKPAPREQAMGCKWLILQPQQHKTAARHGCRRPQWVALSASIKPLLIRLHQAGRSRQVLDKIPRHNSIN